jgi:cytoskeletal protein RodZ
MRSFSLTSLALSSLALLVAASPEPCSDHPGVIHKPGEYTVPEVQKLVNPSPKKSSSSSKKKQASHKSSSSSSSSKSSGSSSSTSSQDNSYNAAPVVHKSDQTASKPKSPSSASSKSWTKNASKIKSKPAPKVQGASPQTVAKGAAEAVGSFADSSYIPPAVAGALSGGELRRNYGFSGPLHSY